MSLKKDSSTVRVNGRNFKINRIATNMRVSTQMIKRMVMVFSHGKVVTFIKVTMLMTNVMGTVRCSGLMVQAIKVNGKKEYSMVMERWYSLI